MLTPKSLMKLSNKIFMSSEQLQEFQCFPKNVFVKVKKTGLHLLLSKKYSFGKTTGGGQIDPKSF